MALVCAVAHTLIRSQDWFRSGRIRWAKRSNSRSASLQVLQLLTLMCKRLLSHRMVLCADSSVAAKLLKEGIGVYVNLLTQREWLALGAEHEVSAGSLYWPLWC